MTRLFHTILPIPECCGVQMRLCGNLEMHQIQYACSRCLKPITASVTFNENPRAEIDPATQQATDATP